MSLTQESKNQPRFRGVTIVAILMVLFGLAEVATGFSHSFFGLVTAQADLATTIGVALGIFYFAGGVLILTRRKWAVALAIILLCADVIGRIAMVVTHLYPIDTFRQTFAIIVGTSIAALFAIYIASKWRLFN